MGTKKQQKTNIKKIIQPKNEELQGFESSAYKKKLEPFNENVTEYFKKILSK